MASFDGGTLASQKELKCQINSVRAPDTQEFLYLAPWEADKDRLCVSEQALTKHQAFFYSSQLLALLPPPPFVIWMTEQKHVCWRDPGRPACVLHTANIAVTLCVLYTHQQMHHTNAQTEYLKWRWDQKRRNVLSHSVDCAVIWYACGEPH